MSLINTIKREKRKRQEEINHAIKKKLKNSNMSTHFESKQYYKNVPSSFLTKNASLNENINNDIIEDIYEENEEIKYPKTTIKENNDILMNDINLIYENNDVNVVNPNELGYYINTYEEENGNKNIKKQNVKKKSYLQNGKDINKLKSRKKRVHEKKERERKKKNINNSSNNDYIWEGLLKKDVILLLLQAIKNMGYKKSAKSLELESGIELEQPIVKEMHKNILSGNWKKAICNLKKLNISKKRMKAIGFLVYEHCFIEYLYKGKYFAALRCLRNKLEKCCFDEDTYRRLHECTTFFMCINNKELEKKHKNNFKSSREFLFEKINRLLPEHIILPPRRLAILLHQSLKYQVDNCLFHNNFSEKKLIKNLLKKKSKKKCEILHNCNRSKTDKQKSKGKKQDDRKLESKKLSLHKNKYPELETKVQENDYSKHNSTKDLIRENMIDAFKVSNFREKEGIYDKISESSLSSNGLKKKKKKDKENDKNINYINTTTTTIRSNESFQENEYDITLNDSIKKSTKRKNIVFPDDVQHNNLLTSKVNSYIAADTLNNATDYHNERKKRNMKTNMNDPKCVANETENNESNCTQENGIGEKKDNILDTFEFNSNAQLMYKNKGNNDNNNDDNNENNNDDNNENNNDDNNENNNDDNNENNNNNNNNNNNDTEYKKELYDETNIETTLLKEEYNKEVDNGSCNILKKRKTKVKIKKEEKKKIKKENKKKLCKKDNNIIYDNHRILSISLLKNHECKKIKLPYYCIKILQGHKDEVWHVSVSANGKYIASSSKDKSIFLWKGVYPFNKLREWNGHIDGVSYIIWSYNSKYLVSGSNDSNIIIWSPKSNKKKLSLSIHSGPITSICWSRDDSVIISSAFDKRIFCTKLSEDLKKYSILYAWSFSTRIQNFVFTKNDKYLIVVASDKNVRVIDYNMKKELYTLPEFDTITSVCASNLYNHILVNIADQKPTIKLWDVKYRYIIQTYRGHKQGRFIVHSTFGGKNENYVISGSEDSLIYIWHKTKGYLLDIINGHASTVSIAIWPISYSKFPYMISASDDHTLMIWNVYPRINKKKSEKKKKKKFIHPFLKELSKFHSLKNK